MQPIGTTKGITPAGLLVIIWLSFGVATIFTLIRTAIRIRIFGRLYVDDLCVYLALLVLTSIAVLYHYATPIMFEFEDIIRGRLAISSGFLDRADFFLRLQFAIIVLFWTCIWAVKVSFLVWYRKMMDVPTNRKIVWNLVTVFTVASYLGCWITQLDACHPIAHYFFVGRCQSKRDIYVSNLSLYYSTAVDIICDLLIMALPLKVLLRLQITTKQKFALGTLFSLVFIIIAFAIVRVVQTSASTEHVNPIWLAVWSMIEASVAVVVSCLPSFHVLLISHHRRRTRAPCFQQQDHNLGEPRVLDKRPTSTIDQEIAAIIDGHEIETNSEAPAAGKSTGYVLGSRLPGIPKGNVYMHDCDTLRSSQPASDRATLAGDEKFEVLEV